MTQYDFHKKTPKYLILLTFDIILEVKGKQHGKQTHFYP